MELERPAIALEAGANARAADAVLRRDSHAVLVDLIEPPAVRIALGRSELHYGWVREVILHAADVAVRHEQYLEVALRHTVGEIDVADGLVIPQVPGPRPGE